MLHSLQDLSSQTRDWTLGHSSESSGPNHWTTREFPHLHLNRTTEYGEVGCKLNKAAQLGEQQRLKFIRLIDSSIWMLEEKDLN